MSSEKEFPLYQKSNSGSASEGLAGSGSNDSPTLGAQGDDSSRIKSNANEQSDFALALGGAGDAAEEDTTNISRSHDKLETGMTTQSKSQHFSRYNIWDTSTVPSDEEVGARSGQPSRFFLPSEFDGLAIKEEKANPRSMLPPSIIKSSLAQAAASTGVASRSSMTTSTISSPISSVTGAGHSPTKPSSLSVALKEPNRPVIGLDAPPPGFLSPIQMSASGTSRPRKNPISTLELLGDKYNLRGQNIGREQEPNQQQHSRMSSSHQAEPRNRWGANFTSQSGQSDGTSAPSHIAPFASGYDLDRHGDVSFRGNRGKHRSDTSSQSSIGRYSHGGVSSRTNESRGGASFGSGGQFQRRSDRRSSRNTNRGGHRTQSSDAIQNMLLTTTQHGQARHQQPGQRGISGLPSFSSSSAYSDKFDEQHTLPQMHVGSSSVASTGSLSFSLPPHSVMPELPLTGDAMDRHFIESALGDDNTIETASRASRSTASTTNRSRGKNKDWRLKMNRLLSETPISELDPAQIPISVMMNEWAKTKSADGATMVESLLNRAEAEVEAGNPKVELTTKMYTIAVDAWAKSREGGSAAKRAEAILQHMFEMYKSGRHDKLKPATGIFNAVVNSWAQSKDEIAPARCEQILNWMDDLYRNGYDDVKPDTYTYNTCMHAHVTCGNKDSAAKVQAVLDKMNKMYRDGNVSAKPETITYNIVINALAKSGRVGAAAEAENLLSKMHMLHEMGDQDIKPNVVTYCAVIDAYAKSMEMGAAARGDTLLANMIQLYQSDPVGNADLRPNTHVFNTVINCWSKSKDQDAASKAEEIFVAMEKLHENGIPGLKPDAFTYTVIIDAWAKTGMRGAASRAEALLSQMESKYLAGDLDLKPNTFTYNAVINSLAKSGEPGAAGKAERVLQNMVNRYRAGGANDVKPTTIHFNAVLDAFAKSGGGRDAAERAENILEWMDELYKSGNSDVKPDTITFNAVLDCWARSGDHRRAADRAEQILHHMDQLHARGNQGIKPDSYTYNVVINAWAKSGADGAAQNAENILATMEMKYREGDSSLKPNTRTYTSLIDCWAKSGEPIAARKAEQILITMQAKFEQSGDTAAKPNTHTANAVMNACAFTQKTESKGDALRIAFRVFEWLVRQRNISPDAYSYTIMLSVCSNLLPRQDKETRYNHARGLFMKCRESGHVNDFVLRKLRHTVTQEEFLSLVDYRVNSNANNLPTSWTRNARGSRGSNKSNRNKWSRK